MRPNPQQALSKAWGEFPKPWPTVGGPLLPRVLFDAWAGEPLPQWLTTRLRVGARTTVADLGPSIEKRLAGSLRELERFFARLLTTRRSSIGHLKAFSQPWPKSLDPLRVPWRPRTVHCLQHSGLLADPERLSSQTIAELLSVASLGTTTLLDLVATAESLFELPHVDTNELLGVIEFAWASLVSEEDPRFSDVIPFGVGTIFQRVDSLTSGSNGGTTGLAALALAASLPAILARVDVIAGKSLDEGIRSYVSALARIRGARLDALLKRLGWGDQPPTTLQDAADQLGVSRERMRQIQSGMERRLPSHPVFMPALDRALLLLEDEAPLPAARAARLIVERGLSQIPFDPANIAAFAQLCGRTPAFSVEDIAGCNTVISSRALQLAQRVPAIARDRSNRFGASNTLDVTECVAGTLPGATHEEVALMLRSTPSVYFLDADWFWVPPSRVDRNRLYNVAVAVLSVVSPVTVSEIRDGARRRYRFRGIEVLPPKHVMQIFFEQHPDFQVDNLGRITSTATLDYRRILGEADQVLVEVLRSSPAGVLDRDTLIRKCLERGINASTTSTLLSYSAVITHVSTHVWALNGVEVSAVAVEALRRATAQRPRERHVTDHGWRENGRLWLSVRLPGLPLRSVFGVPAAISGYLEGRRFSARTRESSSCGTVNVAENGTCWGFSSFLRRYGADEGDILVLEFDLVSDEVVLTLLGDDADDNGHANQSVDRD